MSSTVAFIISMLALVVIIFAFISKARQGSLNIKSRPVGDGRYGTAR